ncbi:gliding motility lipoprotein GldB [Wenyingzhuangia sp. 1_MG-2023]|nr:gliding motility lipoprotein GldB [Wenyingzhuangia sp. 1_MG-2023]
MKQWSCLLLVLVMLFACTSNSKTEQEIEKIQVDTQFALFHDALFTSSTDNLKALKKDYPYMFPVQMPDSLVIGRMQDTLQLFLYKEVKKVYGDFKTQKLEIDDLFRHIKYYEKDFKTPVVVTDLTGVSYQDRVLYANNMLLISLDMYLGKEHEVYSGFAMYLAETFTPKHLSTAIAQKIIETQYPFDDNRTFLGQMVFEGKKLYLLDLFLPKVSDEIKMGYSEKKMHWLKENEAGVWSYFIKNELLFSNKPTLKQRFIDVAPFSKFYTSVDKDSPGGVGKYLGLQIVRSYQKKHQVSIDQLMKMDAEKILRDSGFKPQK